MVYRQQRRGLVLLDCCVGFMPPSCKLKSNAFCLCSAALPSTWPWWSCRWAANHLTATEAVQLWCMRLCDLP